MKLSIKKLIPLKKMMSALSPNEIEALCGRPLSVVRAAAEGFDVQLWEAVSINVGIAKWEKGAA